MSNTTEWVRSEWLTAQAGCIGCVVQSPKLAGRLLSETKEDDFDGMGRTVYQAIRKLFSDGKSPDAVQVGEALDGACNDYIIQTMEIVPSVMGFDNYIRIVREKARMAKIQTLCAAASCAATMQDVQEHISKANEMLVENTSTKVYGLTDLISGFYERKKTAEHYIQTGIQALDAELFLAAGDYVILAGLPSRGKTALALQIALKQSRQYRVGFYSLETSPAKVMDRIIGHYAEIPMDTVKKGSYDQKTWDRIGEAASALGTYYHLDVVDAAGMTVDDIFHEALARRHEIIYIDYLQIISGQGKSRYDVVTEISVRLHQLSQRHKIMVVALSQLSREIKGKATATEEPSMSDLRESGQLEQDADVILMVYCKEKARFEGPRVIKCAKNKEGRTFLLNMAWNGSTQTMSPMSTRTPPPAPQTFRPLPPDSPTPWDQMEINSQK